MNRKMSERPEIWISTKPTTSHQISQTATEQKPGGWRGLIEAQPWEVTLIHGGTFAWCGSLSNTSSCWAPDPPIIQHHDVDTHCRETSSRSAPTASPLVTSRDVNVYFSFAFSFLFKSSPWDLKSDLLWETMRNMLFTRGRSCSRHFHPSDRFPLLRPIKTSETAQADGTDQNTPYFIITVSCPTPNRSTCHLTHTHTS